MDGYFPLIRKIIDSGMCEVEEDYHGLGARVYDLVQDWSDDVDYYLTWSRRLGGPVLEIGSGTGRILLPLARAGFPVTGLDSSDDMHAVLVEKLSAEPEPVRELVTTVAGDMREFDLGEQFPLIIVPLYSFVHVLGTHDRQRALTAMARHLLPGGTIILDVELDRAGQGPLNQEAPGLSVVRYDQENDILLLGLSQTRPVPGFSGRLTVNFLYITVDAGGKASLAAIKGEEEMVAEAEMRQLVTGAGLELVGMYRNYREQELRPSDTGAVVVARRPRDY